MAKQVKLSELSIGQKGIIIKFDNEISQIKLMEMGCLPGELVSIENIALLGCPMVIRVSGYLLSLRKSEASSIWVEVNNA